MILLVERTPAPAIDAQTSAMMLQMVVLLTVLISMAWSSPYLRLLIAQWFPNARGISAKDLQIAGARATFAISSVLTLFVAFADLLVLVLSAKRPLTSGQAWFAFASGFLFLSGLGYTTFALPTVNTARYVGVDAGASPTEVRGRRLRRLLSYERVGWGILLGVNLWLFLVIAILGG